MEGSPVNESVGGQWIEENRRWYATFATPDAAAQFVIRFWQTVNPRYIDLVHQRFQDWDKQKSRKITYGIDRTVATESDFKLGTWDVNIYANSDTSPLSTKAIEFLASNS